MKYEIGDKVKVKKIGLYETNYETETIGKITHIEEHDKLYPYKVDNKIWCMEKEVELVEPIYTNKEDLYKRIFDLENERKDVNDMYMREIKCLEEKKQDKPKISDSDKEIIKTILMLHDNIKAIKFTLCKNGYFITFLKDEINFVVEIDINEECKSNVKDLYDYSISELGKL